MEIETYTDRKDIFGNYEKNLPFLRCMDFSTWYTRDSAPEITESNEVYLTQKRI